MGLDARDGVALRLPIDLKGQLVLREVQNARDDVVRVVRRVAVARGAVVVRAAWSGIKNSETNTGQ
jgi:hypothetical protein